MKIAHTLTFPFAIGLVALAAANSHATETVSPGALDRMAVVETRCPTFSWGADDDAAAYDLVAYVLPDDASQQAELTADTEVMYTRVAGSATSWTPSADQCFAPGGRYVWFVRAVSELAGDEVVAASEWSAGRTFAVPAAPSAEEMQRALDVLRRWEAANGNGSLMLSSGTGMGHRKGVGEGEGHRKSVPTASAAIRGEHPDTSGEKYGVVGTSASPYGAGIAAANLDGGPDLVLDGSADAEPDARLYEWGLERESATDGHFQFINPGAGALNLVVDGTMAATGLDCPDCVTSAEIANLSITGADLADDSVSGAKIADSAVGGTHLASGAVSSAKILDGTIAAADLADGSVTGAKIGSGAVDSGQIRAGAVTGVELADNAVTGAKIVDGGVRVADLGNNAVTSDKIADGTIATADLADASVTAAKLAAGAVTGTELADGSVTSAKIANGSVATADLAAGAVNGTKIADDAVAARHLALGAVDSTAILNGSIFSADIGAGQVNTSAVASLSITTEKLATGAVTASKIADGTITAADVDPTGGLYASKQSVYEQSATIDIDPGFCATARANCLDTNDLPLQGTCIPEPGWSIWLRSMVSQDWTSLASQSGWECDACLEGTSPVPQSITSTILCISVP